MTSRIAIQQAPSLDDCTTSSVNGLDLDPEVP